jgi:hypothetical protein
MLKITMSQLSGLTATSEPVLHTWLARQNLATSYEDAKSGPARSGRFTVANARELLLMADLVRRGMTPGAAATYTRAMVEQIQAKTPRGWFVLAGDSYSVVEQAPDLARLPAMGAPIVCINLSELAERVDKYFSAATGMASGRGVALAHGAAIAAAVGETQPPPRRRGK